MTTFLLMAKQTAIAETYTAERAVELLTMKNLVPAFPAFDSSIDQLKHPMFVARVLVVSGYRSAADKLMSSMPGSPTHRLSMVPAIGAMKNGGNLETIDG
jgi:hypothetical protein